jgi:hypothetical protein
VSHSALCVCVCVCVCVCECVHSCCNNVCVSVCRLPSGYDRKVYRDMCVALNVFHRPLYDPPHMHLSAHTQSAQELHEDNGDDDGVGEQTHMIGIELVKPSFFLRHMHPNAQARMQTPALTQTHTQTHTLAHANTHTSTYAQTPTQTHLAGPLLHTILQTDALKGTLRRYDGVPPHWPAVCTLLLDAFNIPRTHTNTQTDTQTVTPTDTHAHSGREQLLTVCGQLLASNIVETLPSASWALLLADFLHTHMSLPMPTHSSTTHTLNTHTLTPVDFYARSLRMAHARVDPFAIVELMHLADDETAHTHKHTQPITQTQTHKQHLHHQSEFVRADTQPCVRVYDWTKAFSYLWECRKAFGPKQNKYFADVMTEVAFLCVCMCVCVCVCVCAFLCW